MPREVAKALEDCWKWEHEDMDYRAYKTAYRGSSTKNHVGVVHTSPFDGAGDAARAEPNIAHFYAYEGIN